MGWNDDVIPSQIWTRFNYRKWHNSHFQVLQRKSYILSTTNKGGIIFLMTRFNTGVYFYLHLAKKLLFFTISCMMRVINCEGMASSPHWNEYSWGLVKSCSKIWEISKVWTTSKPVVRCRVIENRANNMDSIQDVEFQVVCTCMYNCVNVQNIVISIGTYMYQVWSCLPKPFLRY